MTENIRRSRIGKIPVAVPAGVEVKIQGQSISIKGPKGELSQTLPSEVEVEHKGAELVVTPRGNDRRSRAMHGLSRSLIANMVQGVTQGYSKKLLIQGVGYRVQPRGNRFLLFSLGYSHPILYEIPPGITIEVGKQGELNVMGIDKELVGHTAAKIRSFRKPEHYKGKGIRYADENVIIKAGKTAAR